LAMSAAALLLVANSLPQGLAPYSFQSQCQIAASYEREKNKSVIVNK